MTSTPRSSLLDEAERVYDGDFSPNVRPVPALRARTWIRQGRLDEAASAGSRSAACPSTDELSYLREFEHVTLARLLVAERDEQALDLLGRLLRAAEDGQRSGSMIEIRVVEALAHQSRGDMTSALAVPRRARSAWPSRRATSARSSTRVRR